MWRLLVDRYGKFSQATFVLGPVTIFHGPNEAGKTTLFDALAESLCRVGRSTKKLLAQRYGEARQVELFDEHGQKNEPLLSEDLFRDLLTVRDQQISIEMQDKSAWYQQVRAKLFSGGLDCEWFVRECEKLASDHGGRKHNIEALDLTDKQADLTTALQELQASQHTTLQRYRDIERLDKVIEELRQATLHKKTLTEGMRTQVGREMLAHEKISLSTYLKTYVEYEKVLHQLSELESISTLDRDEIKTLEERETHLRATRAGVQNKKNTHLQEISRLEQEVRLHRWWPSVAWWISFIIPAAAFVFAYVTLSPTFAPLTTSSLIYFVMLGMWFAGISWWTLWSALASHELRRQGRGKLKTEKMALETLEMQLEDLDHAEEQWTTQCQKLCEVFHVPNLETLKKSCEKYDHLQTQFQVIKTTLTDLAQGQSIVEKGLAAKAQLANFERDQVPNPTMPFDAVLALQGKSAKLQQEVDALTSKLTALEQQHATVSTSQQVELRGIAQRMLELSDELSSVEAKIEQIRRDKSAYQICGQIFSLLHAEQDWRFLELKEELEECLATIHAKKAEVHVSTFSAEGFLGTDAHGILRPIQQFSAGTRDFFLLSAKIVLAGRTQPQCKVLLLDDAFGRIDGQRTKQFLLLAKKILADKGWKLIFFNRQEDFLEMAAEVFPNMVVHELKTNTDVPLLPGPTSHYDHPQSL